MVVNKKQIRTIILQESRIKELEKRNKELERGHHDIFRVNQALRRRIKRLERIENELGNVNI